MIVNIFNERVDKEISSLFPIVFSLEKKSHEIKIEGWKKRKWKKKEKCKS